jgi:hypothetical protein
MVSLQKAAATKAPRNYLALSQLVSRDNQWQDLKVRGFFTNKVKISIRFCGGTIDYR